MDVPSMSASAKETAIGGAMAAAVRTAQADASNGRKGSVSRVESFARQNSSSTHSQEGLAKKKKLARVNSSGTMANKKKEKTKEILDPKKAAKIKQLEDFERQSREQTEMAVFLGESWLAYISWHQLGTFLWSLFWHYQEGMYLWSTSAKPMSQYQQVCFCVESATGVPYNTLILMLFFLMSSFAFLLERKKVLKWLDVNMEYLSFLQPTLLVLTITPSVWTRTLFSGFGTLIMYTFWCVVASRPDTDSRKHYFR